MGFRSKVEMHDQESQYGDYRFPTSPLVYSIALATLKSASVTTKDSNPRRGSRDPDEVGILTDTGYKHWSIVDSVVLGKLALGVAEPEERKGGPP